MWTLGVTAGGSPWAKHYSSNAIFLFYVFLFWPFLRLSFLLDFIFCLVDIEGWKEELSNF